jgi:hypothetical protein
MEDNTNLTSMNSESNLKSGTFNTNIQDYTLDELFKLLSIEITTTSDYNEIKTQIETSTNNYIKQFETLDKPEIVNFFMNVKQSLIGKKNDLSSDAQNVIIYQNLYNPINPNNTMYGSDMYNQNNGAGNPIHRKSVSKLLNIDSRFRSNYLSTSTTDYLIDLPYQINNVTEMKLCDLELPSTFYPISESFQNNYFWIRTLDEENVYSYYYILIPDGNYYFHNLIANINSTFQNINLNLSIYFDLNYNNIGGVGEGTGLTSIGIITQTDISNTNITTFELNFNGSFIPNQKSERFSENKPNSKYYYIPNNLDYKQLFGWILGYRKPLYTGGIIDTLGIVNQLGSLFYKSESVLDLSGPKYLFLILDDFNKSVNVNFLTSSVKGLLKDSIIARISQKGQLFSIQSQNDFSVYAEPRYYYGPVNISKFRVQLIDEYGRLVNLNSKDFSFTLRMTTIYSVT